MRDDMTREEAIDRLTYLMSDLYEFCNESKHMSDDDREEMESLDMAIKALEQQPCEDAIYRQAVLKEIPALWNSNGDKDYCMETLRDFVSELPPVTPTRKVGKWTKISNTVPCMNCPICGSTFTLILGGDKMHYCPNCGADMEVEDGSN